MGDYDGGDWDLLVNGRPIEEFTGATDIAIEKSPNPNVGPGERRFGFNHRRNANGVDFSFTVRQTSRDLEYLLDLVEDETPVPVKVVQNRNLDTIQVGQEIAAGTNEGVIMGGSRGHGQDDAEDVSFDVMGIGEIREVKTDDT